MSGLSMELMGEFIGTMMLVLLGDGACAAVNLRKSKAEAAGWVIIALGWGAALTVAVYIASFMSPAHLNPAVTIGNAIAGTIGWELVLPYSAAQLLGGFVGGILVWLAYLPHWGETTDQGAILGTFASGPAIRHYRSNVMAEGVGTFVLVLGLLSLTQHTIADGMTPIVVGLLLGAIGLSLGGQTGFSLNPARDLGPRVAHFILPIGNKGSSDWAYSWVPVVGPILGGIVAAGVFRFIA